MGQTETKKNNLDTKLNPDTGETKDNKLCISLGAIELGHKEEVANVEICSGDNTVNHKQSTLTLALERNREASENAKCCFCFEEMDRSEEGKKQNIVAFDHAVGAMLNKFLIPRKISGTNPATCKLNQLQKVNKSNQRLHGMETCFKESSM